MENSEETSAIFDGEYPLGCASKFYAELCGLMPYEREIVEDYIKSFNMHAFNIFKEDCANGLFADEEIKAPRVHTPEELEEIKSFWHYMLIEDL